MKKGRSKMAKAAIKKSPERVKDQKQKKLIHQLREKENLMKWALLVALVVILLLLLFIGYATDWMSGLNKDSSVTPVSTTLDSAKQAAGNETGANGSSAGTGTDSNSGTNGTNGTSGTGTSGSSTSRTTNGTNTASDTSRSSTSTNTTNNSTTNNTTTTTPPATPSTPPDGLLNLYAGSNIGNTLDSVLSRATNLGVGVVCSTGLLVKECTFTQGDYNVTTKSLLGTGLVTSILKNF